MPWLYLGLTGLLMLMAALTSSPTLIGILIVLILLSAFAAVMGFAAARIGANARNTAAMLGPQELAAIRLRAQRQLQAKASAAAPIETANTARDAQGAG
ncbi:MAG: hypothetical protein COS34_05000 [Lysobacterales bacterium CG02_land_8_20_14_3_00_62_12]|nr:MAG: hypothetical protein COS34_05000 [Xanthomonadales bacterium CG02_land_8_20_14_3_00_62_12]